MIQLTGGQTTKNELMVVRDMRSKSITKKQLQYLEKVLNVQSSTYKTITKVHPILIVYDESKIKDIEIKCKDAPDGEAMVSKEFQLLDKQMFAAILNEINSDWKELRKVYLDFFFVPVTSIDKFRGSFYRALWGVPPPKRKRKKKKKVVK